MKKRYIKIFGLALCVVFLAISFLVACNPVEDGFHFVFNGKAPLICVEGTADINSTEGDYPGVVRAAYDLQGDIEAVTGIKPVVTKEIGGYTDYAIIIGTIGKSEVIDSLISNGKIDVSEVSGKWESYVVETVQDPFGDGRVGTALVIAGADKRGSIYGIYSISELIGVSPWTYFMDSVPAHKDDYVIPEGYRAIGEEPDVKYRGIFINDEEELEAWARVLDNGKHLGPNLYEKIFEVLLRMKANYLWPGMHGISDAFSDYPENPANADYYGIVIGTSHCDMLLRNNLNEWAAFKEEYAAEHPEITPDSIEYDYTVNPEIVREYWRRSVRENKNYEVQWTLGMRGAGDEGFNAKNIDKAPYYGDKCALMEQIFEDQRQILREELNNPTLENVFMMFIPYKEVQQIYNDGLIVPEDVTIMWADDNHGFIRNLPNEEERQREGGHGVYYHYSYWGPDNESYMWLNSMPMTLVYEEMSKALEYGVDTAWIVNSGDTANYMFEIEFFVSLGYDADVYNNSNVFEAYVGKIATREFGAEFADEITQIVKEYTQMTNVRKLEQMGVDIFSSAYGDESERRIAQYKDLWERAEAIYNRIPVEQRDCYYETILFEIRCAYYINAEFYYAHKGNVAYEQERNATAYNCYLHSKEFNQMRKDEISYYNNILQDGKWRNLINPEIYTSPVMSGFANGGPTFAMSEPEMGVVVEGESKETNNSELHFYNYAQGKKYVDVFNKGGDSFTFNIAKNSGFIKVECDNKTVTDEERIWISIDWNKITDSSVGTITLYFGDYTKTITVYAHVDNFNLGEKTYVEQDGYVSVEAEHYSKSYSTPFASWETIKDLGRVSGDMVRADSNTLVGYTEANFEEEAPYLEYNVYFSSAGYHEAEFYRLPSLSSLGRVRFAVSVNEKTPIIIEGERDYGTNNPAWEEGIFTQIIRHKVTVETEEGLNTFRIYMLDPYITIDKFVVYTEEKADSYFDPLESYNTTYNTTPWANAEYERYYETKYTLPTSYDIARDYGNGYFVEQDGKLAIETETAALSTIGASVTNGHWIPARTIEGISMRTVDMRDDFTNRWNVAPTMNFEVIISTPGTYNFWACINSPSPRSSVYAVGVNGSFRFLQTTFSYAREETFVWLKAGTQITFSQAGKYTINLYCVQDGVSIDKIYLSKTSETPTNGIFVQSARTPVWMGDVSKTVADASLRYSLGEAIRKIGNYYSIVTDGSLGSYGAQEKATLMSAIENAYTLLNGVTALQDLEVANAIKAIEDSYAQLLNSRVLTESGKSYILYEDYDGMVTGLSPFGFEYRERYLSPDVSVTEGVNGEKFFNIRTFNEQSNTQRAFVEYAFANQTDTLVLETTLSFNEAEWGSFYLYNENGNNSVCIAFEYAYNEYNIIAYCGGLKTKIASYERNVPIDLKLVIDIQSNRFDVYIEGSLVANDFDFRYSAEQLCGIVFGSSSRNADMRVYEISMYAVKED